MCSLPKSSVRASGDFVIRDRESESSRSIIQRLYPTPNRPAYVHQGNLENSREQEKLANLRVRVGWLNKIWNAYDHCWRERLQFDLLGEEGDAVTTGLSVESMWRLV
jgi:hypothetical protein